MVGGRRNVFEGTHILCKLNRSARKVHEVEHGGFLLLELLFALPFSFCFHLLGCKDFLFVCVDSLSVILISESL